MSDWGRPVRIVKRGTNAVRAPNLAKGHHVETPMPGDQPLRWLMFLAFTRFLPRWQAARR